MSNITTVPRKSVSVHFPNPSLRDDKWHYSYKSAEDFAGAIVQMTMLLQLAVFIFGMKPLSVLLNNDEILALIVMLAGNIFIAFFGLPKLNKRLITYKERKRDEYRRQNAGTLITLFENEGWKVNNGVDAVAALIKSNQPYVVNQDGVRYSIDHMILGRNGVSALLRLDDHEAEDAIEKDEKEKEIDFLIQRYESTHGKMSEEKREGFVAALNLSL